MELHLSASLARSGALRTSQRLHLLGGLLEAVHVLLGVSEDEELLAQAQEEAAVVLQGAAVVLQGVAVVLGWAGC